MQVNLWSLSCTCVEFHYRSCNQQQYTEVDEIDEALEVEDSEKILLVNNQLKMIINTRIAFLFPPLAFPFILIHYMGKRVFLVVTLPLILYTFVQLDGLIAVIQF